MKYEYNLGKVLLTPRGDYSNSEYYEPLDFVVYNNSSYVAKVKTNGHLPTDTAFWQVLASGPDTSDFVLSSSLATVATSGSYNDLINKPTIPAAQVNADWDASSGVAQILNKPTIPDVSGKADKTLVASSMPVGGFLPNVVYNLGALSGNTTFSMAAATDNNIANIWCWTFTTPSTAPTITWPAGITWSGGSQPTINASKSYEVTVMNGLATIIEF